MASDADCSLEVKEKELKQDYIPCYCHKITLPSHKQIMSEIEHILDITYITNEVLEMQLCVLNAV